MKGKWRADFTTLDLIARAADDGSISRAAAGLHLALAAASRRIADFERRAGITIFERHARGIRLTQAGGTLLARLRLVLDGVNGLADTVEDIKSGMTEHLAILACDAAIIQFLPLILKDFVSSFPHVRVELEEMRSTEITQAVGVRRSGIGIIWSDAGSHGLVTVPFRKDELALIVPPGHPFARRRSVRFVETLPFDFVCLEMESPIYASLRREASKLNRQLRTRIQVRGFDALCRMVEAGLGIGIVPRNVAVSTATSMAVVLVELREPWVQRDICIVYRSTEELTRVEQSFVRFCNERIAP